MAEPHLIAGESQTSPSRSASLRTAISGRALRQLCVTCETMQGQLIFVANEAGLGIIPQGILPRCFVDESSRLNQQLAYTAQQDSSVTADLPLVLKGH